MVNKSEIIKENKKRLDYLLADRNPHTGYGSVGDREKVDFSDLENPLYLPKDMLNAPEVGPFLDTLNFKDFSKEYGMSLEQAIGVFSRIRFTYDYEFWAVTTIKIFHKTELTHVPFKLRLAQQILLEKLEEMRLAGLPIRFVLLKARQWGGSTLVQMYMFWIQQIHKRNWHLAICAQDDGAAGNISELYKEAAKEYPPEIASVTFRPYAKSSKNTKNVERGGIIGIGSINNPDQFRSYNYPMLHASEVGVWVDTPKRTAGQLVASLRSIIPAKPYTLIGLESTAKGVGTFFHKEWLKAEKKETAYADVFVPWFMIDMYIRDIDNYSAFIDTMGDYEWFQWDQGATLEGINWYRDHKVKENFDDWMMFNEFPTTPEEAFVASGSRYFSPRILSNSKANLRDPIFRGVITPRDVTSRKELELSKFEKNPRGRLRIWAMPKTIVTVKGKTYKVVNRYCSAADIGGVTKDADYSHITLLDRYWMLYGGGPQIAADWHGHLDQDLFAWVAAQLSYMYDKALLGIEMNSLRKEKSSGDHYLTILDTIKDHYDNLYIRNKFDSTQKDWEPKYGFHTNMATKDMILSALRAGLRTGQYTELDYEAYKEYGYYERKDDGTLGAVAGQHDDRVMTRALAYWMATSPIAMDPVKLIPYEPSYEVKKKGRVHGII